MLLQIRKYTNTQILKYKISKYKCTAPETARQVITRLSTDAGNTIPCGFIHFSRQAHRLVHALSYHAYPVYPASTYPVIPCILCQYKPCHTLLVDTLHIPYHTMHNLLVDTLSYPTYPAGRCPVHTLHTVHIRCHTLHIRCQPGCKLFTSRVNVNILRVEQGWMNVNY